MNAMIPDGKVGIFNNTVGLCNTGQTSKGKQNQNNFRESIAHTTDSAGDFQKQITEREQTFR